MSTAGLMCNREVVFCTGDESLVQAARRMASHHVGDLLLVEERDGMRYPVGIVTDRDLALQLASPAFDRDAPIRSVATGSLVTAREDEFLHDALKRMRAHGIRRLPVVDERGALQGLLTLDDVLEHVAEELSDLATLVTRELRRETYGSPGAAPITQRGVPMH